MLEKIKFVSLGSDSSPVYGRSYYYKVLEILRKYWAPMLVITVCKDRRGLNKVMDGVYFYCVPSLFHYLLLALGLFRKVRSKAVISQDPFFYGLMGRIIKSKDVKHFVSLHSDFFFNPYWKKYRIINPFLLLLGRYILKRADFIRLVYPKKELEILYGEKVLYLPSDYVDTSKFKEKPGEKEYDFIFAGRLHHQKNIDYLVSLFSHFSKRYPYYKGAIAGDGEKKEKIKVYKLVREHKNIKYLGFVKDIHELYAKSKVLVLTSPSEGAPRAVAEAITSSCLILAPPVGKIKDMLSKNPSCGEFVTFNLDRDIEKLRDIISNYTTRKIKCLTKEEKWESKIRKYAEEYLRRID